jgi:hypothetical protein
MVAVVEFDVHQGKWIDHHNGTAPQAAAPAVPSGAALWRQAVLAVAADAKASLPNSHGRIDAAVAIVLAGDAELTGEHTGRVASQSDEGTVYTLCNGECECRDFPRAPEGWCKHRLSIALLRRALRRAKAEAKALDGEAAPAAEEGKKSAAAEKPAPVVASVGLPEAPASVNVYVEIGGRKVQVTLRDMDEQRLLVRLEALLARYPVSEAAETPQAPATPPEGWCPVHELQMRWNDPKAGDKRPGWWSHRLEDGSFCRGKAPRH